LLRPAWRFRQRELTLRGDCPDEPGGGNIMMETGMENA